MNHSVESTTVGVTGHRWRASVSPWGAVAPWGMRSADGTEPALQWFIAADDRWHRPDVETTVRQRRLDGAPVIETRVRIPDGDAVHRVWSVADQGGLTIVEVENDSPLPFAVAFSGLDVMTERPPSSQAIQGIELPDDAFALPVGHRASIRVAIPHQASVDHRSVAAGLRSVPDAATVARGWTAIAGRASRLELPDSALAEAVVAARCDLMLEGPIDHEVDAIGFVLDVGELVRCGDDAEAWLPEIVGPLESMAKSTEPTLVAALTSALRVATGAGDTRAAADIGRWLAQLPGDGLRLGPFSELRRSASAGRFIHDVERHVVNGGCLLPSGIPTSWLGANFEVHDLPTSAQSAISFAVRWHGERPAVLWDQRGMARTLTAPVVDPAWSSSAVSGEALWAAPARLAGPSLSISVDTDDSEPRSTSFN